MIDGRAVARIYANSTSRDVGMDKFIADNAAEISGLNLKHNTINLRNGDKVYFIVLRSNADTYQIGGYEFNSIWVDELVDEEYHQVLRSRLRGPGDTDKDIEIGS